MKFNQFIAPAARALTSWRQRCSAAGACRSTATAPLQAGEGTYRKRIWEMAGFWQAHQSPGTYKIGTARLVGGGTFLHKHIKKDKKTDK